MQDTAELTAAQSSQLSDCDLHLASQLLAAWVKFSLGALLNLTINEFVTRRDLKRRAR